MSPPKRDPGTTDALRTSLIRHGQTLIAREGPAALTMRALAVEAGCAVGMPYKIFADRSELVAEICHAEFLRLREAHDELLARVDTGTVGANLTWFSELLLDSPAVALVHEILGDRDLGDTVAARIHESGVGPAWFEKALTAYLAAEKDAGRVASPVDAEAIGFLIAGAVHNLVVSGAAWPRPSARTLRRRLDAVAAAIAPSA